MSKPNCFNYADHVHALEKIKELEDENAMLRNAYKLIADADKPVKPIYEDGVPVCRNCGSDLEWINERDGYKYRADFCYCCGYSVDWTVENDR